MKLTRVLSVIAFYAIVLHSCGGSDISIPGQGANGNGNENGSNNGGGSNTTNRKEYVSSVAELKALGTLNPGDTVVWKNGTYTDAEISLSYIGSQSQHIVLTGEEGGKVIFKGKSRLIIKGKYITAENLWFEDPDPTSGKAPITLDKGSSHSVVRNCAVTGYNTVNNPVNDTKWVSLYGTGHTVENCVFDDKRNIGCLMVIWFEAGITPNHNIKNNYFSRPVSLLDDNNSSLNGQETIRIGTSDYSMQDGGCLVEGNHFYRCDGETEVISNKSCHNIYRNNLFTECQGTLTLRHGNDCLVEGNYFIANRVSNTGGIRVIGERHTVKNNYLENLRGSGYKTGICLVRAQQNPLLSGYWQVQDCLVSGNTLVNCRYAMHLNYGSSNQTVPVISTKIENNVICNDSSSDYTIYYYSDPQPEIMWSGNTIFGGRQVGIEIATVSTKPTLPDVTGQYGAISEASGTDWTGWRSN